MENIATVIKALFREVGGNEILEGAGFMKGGAGVSKFMRLDAEM